MNFRLSQSKRIGPLRVRFSEPLGGSGQPYFTVGMHTPFGYLRFFKAARRRRS
jgi:hypothetical protein